MFSSSSVTSKSRSFIEYSSFPPTRHPHNPTQFQGDKVSISITHSSCYPAPQIPVLLISFGHSYRGRTSPLAKSGFSLNICSYRSHIHRLRASRTHRRNSSPSSYRICYWDSMGHRIGPDRYKLKMIPLGWLRS